MKQNEIVDYKGISTIQMTLDEDGKKVYLYTHNFFKRTNDEDTIKGAKEMLDWEDGQAREVRNAISILSSRGYKIYREIA